MPSYLFTIDSVPFYASEEPNWQEYGVQDAYSILGRPLPSGPGSFTVTLHAVPYATQTGAGDPLESSGTFQQIFNLRKTAIASTGGRQTFTILDPAQNTYVTVKGIINSAKFLAQMQGGMANPNVNIEVNSAFISDDSWGSYSGGDTVPTVPPVYIPGDPLPPPPIGYHFGWGIGRWGYGYWGRGEGEPV